MWRRLTGQDRAGFRAGWVRIGQDGAGWGRRGQEGAARAPCTRRVPLRGCREDDGARWPASVMRRGGEGEGCARAHLDEDERVCEQANEQHRDGQHREGRLVLVEPTTPYGEPPPKVARRDGARRVLGQLCARAIKHAIEPREVAQHAREQIEPRVHKQPRRADAGKRERVEAGNHRLRQNQPEPLPPRLAHLLAASPHPRLPLVARLATRPLAVAGGLGAPRRGCRAHRMSASPDSTWRALRRQCSMCCTMVGLSVAPRSPAPPRNKGARTSTSHPHTCTTVPMRSDPHVMSCGASVLCAVGLSTSLVRSIFQ